MQKWMVKFLRKFAIVASTLIEFSLTLTNVNLSYLMLTQVGEIYLQLLITY